MTNIDINYEESCVYTALLGDYELLNEQPISLRSDVPFICITDNYNLKSESWEVRYINPIFPHDPIRSQRDIKLRPHVHLPNFNRSVYIDNSIILKMQPERLLDMVAAAPSGFLMSPHSFRDSVLDEFIEVSRQGFDDNGRIFEQLNHYLLECPEVLDERPWWGGFMVRDHRNPQLRRALEMWVMHVMRYSRRDQLSANVAFRAAGIQPSPLPIDNHESEFHSWPHSRGRDRNRGERNQAVSMLPLIGRLRLAETRLQTAEDETKAREADVGALRVQLATLSAQQQAHDTQLAALSAERQVYETQFAAFSAERQVYETQLAALSAERQVHQTRIAALSAQHQVYETQIATLSAEQESLFRSTSWRLTEPLRRLIGRSPGVHRSARKALQLVCRGK